MNLFTKFILLLGLFYYNAAIAQEVLNSKKLATSIQFTTQHQDMLFDLSFGQLRIA